MAAAAALGAVIEPEVRSASSRSAIEAARACGCGVGQIVKSLIFRGSVSGAPLLFLVAGDRRLDEREAGNAAGEPVLRPDATFVRDATGYAIGGIPPFGHARASRAFIDQTLLAHDRVFAAAGHPNAVFAIAPQDLRRLAGAEVLTAGATMPDPALSEPA